MAIPIVNTRDRNIGIIASFACLIALFIYLVLHMVQLPDPPITNPPLKAEAIFDELEMEELVVESAGGVGGGEPSDDIVKEPTPQVEEIATAPNPTVKVQSGEANKTNTTKPSTNESTTTKKDDNPFSKGGSGSGKTGGNGDLTGTDNSTDGPGGTSVGYGKDRTRYNEISTDNIITASKVTVALIVTVNENGQVVAARVRQSGTTTNDQLIISKVIAAAKSQLRYQKIPGSGLQEVYYTAEIHPN